VDALTASLMGFDPDEIGYLHYCRRLGLGVANFADVSTLGNVAADAVQRHFRPHPTYHRQRKWRRETVSRLLHKAPQADLREIQT
jgi:hypothetical protein